ncbi:MAG: glycosyltransferase [Chloroflexi bacterium]|uniref:Glycosyltransferase n=1 Tax=Candidatus Chlorohelix allophototropha TaxID=3003348 RepID=A0A8T7M7L3_9CHLR|nr:glycosyltransferase [Chloroflexota bacterium]WJW69908.1 glycosyltransferase family 2 protein [Chloroflexota bacterium L227-S17]
MLLYQIIVTAPIVYMLLVLVVNFFTLRALGSYGYNRRFSAADAALISVLVPARNEAGNIARCIRSLLNQDYPNLEIIVLDDGSDDATVAILESIAREDFSHRLRLVSGQELPEGWLGKNWACYQLYHYAEGDYLLFTDADTVHGVRSVSSAISALEKNEADFLSIFPRQETDSLAERLAIPLMMMYLIGLLPTWMVSRSPRPSISAANGQYMFFTRNVYEQIGGHAAVKNIVLEDVIMARRIKQAGYKVILPDGTDSVSCRMYRNIFEVWQGFSKNLFAFFNYKVRWLGLFLLLNILAYIGPYFWLLAGWVTGQPASVEWLWLPIAQILMTWIIRFGVSLRFGFRVLDIILHPLSIIYMVIIGINSVRWRKRGVQWKGRVYSPEMH